MLFDTSFPGATIEYKLLLPAICPFLFTPQSLPVLSMRERVSSYTGVRYNFSSKTSFSAKYRTQDLGIICKG
jgi:uncharacterized membrane protein YjgN (DUF898 family)